jgi:Fe-Mn family superoxide dismutase
MKPNGGGKPSGTLLNRLEQDFGSFEEFCTAFKHAAVTQFGSGWAWLIEKEGKLQILKTGNADTPMVYGAKALLTCDVWEHAYYLDYQNRRPDYVDIFLKHLVNWDFVASNLS